MSETFVTAQSPDIGQFGTFSRSITFSNPETATGFFEIFAHSAKDGSEIDKTISLIRF